MCVAKIFTFLAVFLALCYSTTATARPRGECVLSMQNISSLFPVSTQAVSSTNETLSTPQFTQVTFASNFQVLYYPTYKLLTNFKAKEKYVLYQCGTLKPDVAEATKYFEIPLTAVQTDDTTVVGFMKLLGVDSRIAFTSSYAVDSCQQKLASVCRKQSSNDPTALAAQGLLVDSVMTYGASPNNKSITFTATSDNGPLARAEWVKVMSTFFNAEMQANAIFSEIQTRYNNLKALAAPSASGTITPGSASPRLRGVWLYRLPAYSYGTYTSPLTWYIEYNVPYKNDFLRDAGATLFTGEQLMANLATVEPSLVPLVVNNVATGKITVNNTAVGGNNTYLGDMSIVGRIMRAMLKDMDFVVDTSLYDADDVVSGAGMPAQDITISVFQSNWGLTEAADATNLTFLRRGLILRTDASMRADGTSSDWFESAVSRPDLVLRDFVAILQPQAIDPTTSASSVLAYTPSYIRKVTQSLSVLHSASQCANLVGCQMMAAPICPLVWRECNGAVTFATTTQRCPVDQTCSTNQLSSSSASSFTHPARIALIVLIVLAVLTVFL